MAQRQIEQSQTAVQSKHAHTETAANQQGPVRSAVHPFMRLQRAVGNRLAGAVLQTKLKIGQPNDRFEQEADRVADRIMGPSWSPAMLGTNLSRPVMQPRIQRVCSQCQQEFERPEGAQVENLCPSCQANLLQRQMMDEDEEEEPEAVLQTKANPGQARAAPSHVASSINGLKGGGRPLPDTTKTFFESRFGHDLGQVRVHTNSQAEQTARAVNARAFTVGQDMVFGAGEYAPETQAGQRLLAHELTHVVQQTGFSAGGSSQIQRKETAKEEGWLPELDEILPKHVGLLTHMDRVSLLVNIFDTEPLEEHVRLIHKDAAAKKLTLQHGVSAIVALYDTRKGNKLNVSAAQQALKNSPKRYQRSSLEKMRLVPGQNAILTATELAALTKKLKKLKDDLKTTYELDNVVDGSTKWTLDHLQQVTEAFKFLPTGDKKALKGVVLKRVTSLGGKTAGRFTSEQGVEGTTVTNEATLELANRAFTRGAPDSYDTIVHEVGHAVASMPTRTAAHAEHKAITEENRLVGLSNAAVEKFNEAVEERNQTVEPLNDAVKEYNAARRSRDKERIASAKADYEAAKKTFKAKKAEEDRLKAIWKKADKQTQAAKKVTAQKAQATKKTKISASDLSAIKKKSAADKNRHDAKLTAANKKVSSLNAQEEGESSAYVTAIRQVSDVIKDFAQQTETQEVSEDDVEKLVEDIKSKISQRDTERGNLTTTNKDNSALAIFIQVEQAQDAWFESAEAHSLAHNRSARVQKFVKFVEKNRITPRTIYPPDSYAEENWPHKPEEFYAEVYSMFVVKPNDLKAKSKTLFNWFKAKKYL